MVQLGTPEVVTLIKVTMVSTEYIPTIVAVPAPSNIIVWFAPLLIVYVTVASGVPVKVNVELVLAHIVDGVNEAVAIGSITVNVMV